MRNQIATVTAIIIGTDSFTGQCQQSGYEPSFLAEQAVRAAHIFCRELKDKNCPLEFAAQVYSGLVAPYVRTADDHYFKDMANRSAEITGLALKAVNALKLDDEAPVSVSNQPTGDEDGEGKSSTVANAGAEASQTQTTGSESNQQASTSEASQVSQTQTTSGEGDKEQLARVQAKVRVASLDLSDNVKKLLLDHNMSTVAEVYENDTAPKSLEKDVNGIGSGLYKKIMSACQKAVDEAVKAEAAKAAKAEAEAEAESEGE